MPHAQCGPRYAAVLHASRRRVLAGGAAVALLAAALVPDDAAAPWATGSAASSLPVVQRYGILERTFHWDSSSHTDPWEQVTLTMTLVSPTGRRYQIGGFYEASNTWKARFSPSEVGRWTWTASLIDGGRRASFRGAFGVARGGGHGFVRRSPYNRFRWTFSDRRPYYPVGIGDCIFDVDRSGSPLDNWGLDGDFRHAGEPDYGRVVGIDTYLRAYAAAGVNLFRWSVDNCSFRLYRTIDPRGNIYLRREGQWGDALVRHLRRHGFRVYMTIFGFKPPFAPHPTASQLRAVERYVKYVVDRYGAYVDFWELMNEAYASDTWYRKIARYLRSVDPYRHPISTSWERPDLPEITVNSPHWYETESELESDRLTWHKLQAWKAAGKPVIVGEQGNTGSNWDERSGVRMRIRAWTAFFAEGTLIFWNSSYAKDYRNEAAANIYLGPEERRYLAVLQAFTNGFDPRGKIVALEISGLARGYALRGPVDFAAYLCAYRNRAEPTDGVRISINPAAAGQAAWVNPATGAVISRQTIPPGKQTLEVPSFMTDIALKIRQKPTGRG